MMFKKSKKIKTLLIFFDRNQLFFAVESSSQLLYLELPPEVFFDLEIVNEEKLLQLVDNFLDEAKLDYDQVLLLLSDQITYISQVDDNSKDGHREVNNFASLLPFESVFAKEIKVKRNKFIVAINRNLYEPFLKFFSELDKKVSWIIPINLLPSNIYPGQLDINVSKNILRQLEKIEQFNLLESLNHNKSRKELEEELKSSQKSTVTLVLVFLSLLVILLGLVIWQTFFQESEVSKYQSVEQDIEKIIPSSTPELEIIPTPSPTPINFSDYSLSILNGSRVSGDASQVAQLFSEIGFVDITTDNAKTINKDSFLVVYKSSIDESVINAILSVLEKQDISYIAKEVAESDSDIVITTALQ